MGTKRIPPDGSLSIWEADEIARDHDDAADDDEDDEYDEYDEYDEEEYSDENNNEDDDAEDVFYCDDYVLVITS